MLCSSLEWHLRHSCSAGMSMLTSLLELAGGHYGAVVDVCWGFGDGCLLSASHDQTVRVFSDLPCGGWCEVARPQVTVEIDALVQLLALEA